MPSIPYKYRGSTPARLWAVTNHGIRGVNLQNAYYQRDTSLDNPSEVILKSNFRSKLRYFVSVCIFCLCCMQSAQKLIIVSVDTRISRHSIAKKCSERERWRTGRRTDGNNCETDGRGGKTVYRRSEYLFPYANIPTDTYLLGITYHT
jgi:hypothetical protein